jgi:hypothetical protein
MTREARTRITVCYKNRVLVVVSVLSSLDTNLIRCELKHSQTQNALFKNFQQLINT